MDVRAVDKERLQPDLGNVSPSFLTAGMKCKIRKRLNQFDELPLCFDGSKYRRIGSGPASSETSRSDRDLPGRHAAILIFS
jgi:hypothetical protein